MHILDYLSRGSRVPILRFIATRT